LDSGPSHLSFFREIWDDFTIFTLKNIKNL